MKKKVLFIVLLMALVFVCAEPVLARDIASCQSAFGANAMIDEKIPNVVSTIVKVIRVVVPILLVVLGMIDLVKGITAGKEDEIKKGTSIFIKRLIAAVIVFFVFVIVQLVISLVADSSERTGIMDCVKCFVNGECTYK